MTTQWLVEITAEAEVIPGDPKPDDEAAEPETEEQT